MKRLRIESPAPHGRHTRVWLGDEEITDTVQRLELVVDAQDVNRAVLTTVHDGVTVDVVLPETERGLGWGRR